MLGGLSLEAHECIIAADGRPCWKFRMKMTKVEKLLLRIRAGKPLAVILGSSVGGLSFVRSLNRRNVPTLQLDSDKGAPMYTRYGEAYLLPPLRQSPSEWLRLLEFVGKRLEPDHR